jgi:cell division protease FtsH
VPFFTITGSDFMEMFVGVGAKRVRDMFQKAKEKSPSIIFIDEIDSIGRKRGAGLGGGHDEREQTLNQMLSELDGFEPNEGVVVMGATNRPDILDKALLRPGRFDRQITVHLPTQEHREQILEIHAQNKKISEDVNLDEIARSTPGFSGADLRNLLNEAALIASRHKRKAIEQVDIDQARDKVMMGLKREGIRLSDKEKKLLAYHEAGHAIVAAVLPNADPIHKVTVIPRGKAMGVTMQLPEKEKLLYEKKYMLDRMAVMMGGRAAENLIFNTATSGAENDLKQITKLARKMVLDWGMSDKFNNIAFGGQREQVFLGEQMGSQREYSDSTAREIDEEVHRILEESFERALTTIKENRDILDRLANELLEHEEVSGKKVMEWLNGEAEEDQPEEENEEPKDKQKKEDSKSSEEE